MARNTGRGSRASNPKQPSHKDEWIDSLPSEWEVWSEPEGVAIYQVPKDRTTHRMLFTPDEAEHLAMLLRTAAMHVRENGGN